jgi:hypothetical protein
MKFAETADIMKKGSGYIWFRKYKGKYMANYK